MNDYLVSVRKQLAYYKMLGEKTMEQLSDEQLVWQYNSDSNSVAVIVKHMWGNMLSRWTDFLKSDGEKEWRNREAEFEPDLRTREEILEKWEAGWRCMSAAIAPLSDTDLPRVVYIRNEGHSVVEAVNRQLAHYAYHVGQIVFIGKMLRGDQWRSLSIPRGGTEAFNARKFEEGKRRTHFSDEFLEDKA